VQRMRPARLGVMLRWSWAAFAFHSGLLACSGILRA